MVDKRRTLQVGQTPVSIAEVAVCHRGANHTRGSAVFPANHHRLNAAIWSMLFSTINLAQVSVESVRQTWGFLVAASPFSAVTIYFG